MNKSEQINELAAALAKAQGQMEGAKKDSENPFFRSKYADLASVVEAIRGPFAEHGLSYVQAPTPVEGERVCVETILLHASGQWIANMVDLPVTKQDAQGYGSALTYARRYGLQAIAGVAAEDDDGNAAAKAKPATKPTAAARHDQAVKNIVEETTEQEAARLFPQEEELRSVLVAHINTLKAEKRMTDAKFTVFCRRWIGEAALEMADVAALTDLEKALSAL